MDQCMKVQEQLGAELQKQITMLSNQEEEHIKTCEIHSEELSRLKDAMKELHSRLEDEQKLLRDSEAQVSSLEKQKTELENAAEETEVRCTTFRRKHLFLLNFLSLINCKYCTYYLYFFRPSRRLKLRRSAAFWSR